MMLLAVWVLVMVTMKMTMLVPAINLTVGHRYHRQSSLYLDVGLPVYLICLWP